MNAPDIIFHRGLFTTLDRANPAASAVAIKDGVFTAVGHDNEATELFLETASRGRTFDSFLADVTSLVE